MGLADLDAYLEGKPAPGGTPPTTGTAGLGAYLKRAPELTTGQKIVRGAALSTVGGVIGGAAGAIGGSVLPGPGTTVGALGGTMIGSAAGEAITQFVDPLGSGVTDPSLTQIGLAGLLPAVPAVLRRFFISLPGAAAGLQEFLFSRLGNKGERVISKFAPTPGTASDLFRQAKAAGASVDVPLVSTTGAATEIATEVGKSKFVTGGGRALAAKAQEFAQQGVVPFDEFRLNQVDVGALVRSLERKAGPALGRAKKLYASMWDDLDAALNSASGPVGETLRGAIDAFKREEAAKFFKEWWIHSTVRRIGQRNLDVDAMLTKIDRHRDVLARLMPSSEIDDTIGTLTHFVKIPTMAKTPQLGFEQVPFAQRALISGSMGAIAGGLSFGPSGAGIGAATSILAVEAISTALTTGPGRMLVKTLAQRSLTVDQIGNVLMQGARSAFRPDEEVRLNRVRVGPAAREAAR